MFLPLNPCCYSLLATLYSYSLLPTPYSLLANHYFLLSTRYFLLATRYFLLHRVLTTIFNTYLLISASEAEITEQYYYYSGLSLKLYFIIPEIDTNGSQTTDISRNHPTSKI